MEKARIPKWRLGLYALLLSGAIWVSVTRPEALAEWISGLSMQEQRNPDMANGEFESKRIDSALADSSCFCREDDSVKFALSVTPPFGLDGFAVAYSLSRKGEEQYFAFALNDTIDGKWMRYKVYNSSEISNPKASVHRAISSLLAYEQDSTQFLIFDGDTWIATLCDRGRDKNIRVRLPGKLDDTPNANRLLDAFAMMLESIETQSDSINNLAREYSATLKRTP